MRAHRRDRCRRGGGRSQRELPATQHQPGDRREVSHRRRRRLGPQHLSPWQRDGERRQKCMLNMSKKKNYVKHLKIYKKRWKVIKKKRSKNIFNMNKSSSVPCFTLQFMDDEEFVDTIKGFSTVRKEHTMFTDTNLWPDKKNQKKQPFVGSTARSGGQQHQWWRDVSPQGTHGREASCDKIRWKKKKHLFI